MQILARIAAGIDLVNETIGRLISWFALLVVINVFLVVILRYAFDIGYVWMQELYVWIHAAVFMVGAGYTLRHDGHVRIDVIYRDASEKYKAIVNLVGSLFLGLPFMWTLFFKALPYVQRSFERGERSSEIGGLPALYLLKALILIFAVLMALQLISMIARSLLTLLAPASSNEEAL